MNEKKKIRYLLCRVLFLVLTLSCQSKEDINSDNITISSPHSKTTLLNIPAKLLSIRKSLYNNNPLRKGPGYHYPLTNDLLTKNEEYLFLDYYKNWIKVLNLKSKIKGWVKKNHMIKIKRPNQMYSIKLSDLPIIINTKKNGIIRSFDRKKILQRNIEKGKYFISLNNSQKEKLIWLEKSNKIAWLY